MKRMFYIMGPSSCGKDTIYKMLLNEPELDLKKVILYTTRPIRDREVEGRQYHFVSKDELDEIRRKGLIIEERTYDTVYGDWTYATVDEGMDSEDDYLVIGTLESYMSTCRYYGNDRVVPLYIQVEDGVRLKRAYDRESAQEHPKYEEMCRRFLSDSRDFSEEKIAQAGITRVYENKDLASCVNEIKESILKIKKEG